jgi:hypothetical protein
MQTRGCCEPSSQMSSGWASSVSVRRGVMIRRPPSAGCGGVVAHPWLAGRSRPPPFDRRCLEEQALDHLPDGPSAAQLQAEQLDDPERLIAECPNTLRAGMTQTRSTSVRLMRLVCRRTVIGMVRASTVRQIRTISLPPGSMRQPRTGRRVLQMRCLRAVMTTLERSADQGTRLLCVQLW